MRMRSEAEWIKPSEIEKRSFEIIGGELERMGIAIPQETAPVVMRCIHTSADFDYAKNLVFTEDVIPKAVETLRRGAVIITDTHMAQAGINKKSLEKLGGRTLCFMSDEDVAYEAKSKETTRAAVSMDKALRTVGASAGDSCIYAVGNAPTALLRLAEQIRDGRLKPALIIAVPVGFVNVVQAKEEILSLDVPCIAALGRKGGSNIAACICNALLYMAGAERRS
jgi:precorrin-8X/cobalt-precorrin-8 methylmutase